MTINKEKIYIKNLDDLEELKKTQYPYQVITINSDIHFDIDYVDLNMFHLSVNGNLYAKSIRVWDIKAHNIEAYKIIDAYQITAKNIELYRPIQAGRIYSYNLIAPKVTAEDVISDYIEATYGFRADNVKIGNEYKKTLSDSYFYEGDEQ